MALTIAGCAAEDPGLDDALAGDTGRELAEDEGELAFPGEAGVVEEGILLLDPDRPVIAYEVVRGQRVFQGDILLTDDMVAPLPEPGKAQQPLAVTTQGAHLWPKGVVPYVITGGLKDKASVEKAIAHVNAKTSLKLVLRSGQADYVRFVDGIGCSSYVGRIGGAQDITLNQNCGFGAAVHEILHAVGAWHEQQRGDRDSHVSVLLQNVEAGRESNFQKYGSGSGKAVTTYDRGSLMHYGSYAFSKNGKPTLVRASDKKPFEANRTAMSARDVTGVQVLYSQEACGCPKGKVCNAAKQCVYFVDVKPGSTHAKNIDKIFEAGVTTGCGHHRYCPGDVVDRGQMASFLARALGLPKSSGSLFTDVPASHTHHGNIYAIHKAGITTGCASDKYCPSKSVTRAQMATFLARALKLKPVSGTYFSDTAGNGHEKNINAIYLEKITSGCGSGKYCPGDAVTREQMASFLARAFGL